MNRQSNRQPATAPFRIAAACRQPALIGLLFGIATLVSFALPAMSSETEPLRAATTHVDEEKEEDKSELRVAFRRPINSKDAIDGETIEVELREDWKIDGQIIAPKGSRVLGYLEKMTKRTAKGTQDKQERFRRQGGLKLHFDRLITPTKELVNIAASPRAQHCAFSNNHEFRQIVIGDEGELLKAASLHVLHNTDFEVGIPKSLLQFRGFNINVLPGDEFSLEFKLHGDNPSLAHSSKTIH